MNVYDRAHELARVLRESEEVKEYKRVKEKIDGNPGNKRMVDDYRKAQLEAYSLQMQGKQPSKEDMEKMTKLMNLISLNSEVREFLEAEMKFSRLWEDILKILGDAAGIDFSLGLDK